MTARTVCGNVHGVALLELGAVLLNDIPPGALLAGAVGGEVAVAT